ncbi:MAG: Holliday junction branch migration protein RuvA [Xanthomonadaceae bacterium]|nr:Holliday junction branch migration protein RuvA [Rhodospirillaceae bacterium]NIA17591.1 Holliday junction branch migration protein RuvA [Xanthomonadaceae bacterium]
MIAYLKGTIIEKDDKSVILLTGSVGYQVLLGENFLSKLKKTQEIDLFTYQYWREDSIKLYGFKNKQQLDLFILLISISGVGPSSASILLDSVGVNSVKSAIASNRPEVLSQAPRLGKKTAERIIVELKNKVFIVGDENLKEIEYSNEDNDVVNALTNLGYSLYNAQQIVKSLPKEIKGVDNKIKQALKEIGRNK